MKKTSFLLVFLSGILLSQPVWAQQHRCGNTIILQNMEQQAPQRLAQLRQLQDQIVTRALATPQAQAKTSVLAPIPLVFHFVLTQDKYYLLGGDTGIQRRVRTELAHLNKDFSATNTDLNKVPAPFASLIGNAGAVFGLAKATSANTISAGIEVRIVNNPPAYDVNDGCSIAKHSTWGLPAWDNTRYLNIWVTNIFGGGGTGGIILGVTVPPSFTDISVGFPVDEMGIVLNYGAIGVRDFPNQYFIPEIDQGRTLTHEMGHYFELRHIWGDDDGKCPGNGGQDDGISDTPPQADATFCTAGVCPTFPKFDACSPSGNGIMFMNFMDYVDDASMYLFTRQQAQVMNDQFAASTGESYSLTQNPGLAAVGVDDARLTQLPGWNISPNPAQDRVLLTLDPSSGFRGLEITSLTGQVLLHIGPKAGALQYQLDLSTLPRGFYIVRCVFEAGVQSRKLVLE
ncbi:MAG: zinc-dependent metalloprotease [Bacteroidetes bacterium]|nr:zinc-dependent metalloprotease [Bacteroidota bacterium]MBS1628821.1 zinc-dependent metalloprotease [Bacteroidota bacterium]